MTADTWLMLAVVVAVMAVAWMLVPLEPSEPGPTCVDFRWAPGDWWQQDYVDGHAEPGPGRHRRSDGARARWRNGPRLGDSWTSSLLPKRTEPVGGAR